MIFHIRLPARHVSNSFYIPFVAFLVPFSKLKLPNLTHMENIDFIPALSWIGQVRVTLSTGRWQKYVYVAVPDCSFLFDDAHYSCSYRKIMVRIFIVHLELLVFCWQYYAHEYGGESVFPRSSGIGHFYLCSASQWLEIRATLWNGIQQTPKASYKFLGVLLESNFNCSKITEPTPPNLNFTFLERHIP